MPLSAECPECHGRGKQRRTVKYVVRIPAGEALFPGERWTPERAIALLTVHASQPPSFVASEVDRYLGMPGQAISYKVGERVWLECRADAQARHGDAFFFRVEQRRQPRRVRAGRSRIPQQEAAPPQLTAREHKRAADC